MGTTCIKATTLDDAASAEESSRAGSGGPALLGALARLAPIVLGLIRLFSWLWVVVCAILLVPSALEWMGGATRAGREALYAGVGLVAAFLLARTCGWLIRWLHTYADRVDRSPALARQANVAGELLRHLRESGRAGGRCSYRREMRSLHGWIDDDGFRDRKFTWLSITTPWDDEPLSITAELSFDVDRVVELTETWSFRGRLAGGGDRLRQHLGEEYEVEMPRADELVARQHRSVRRLFSRGTSATPMSIGSELDSEVLLGALPVLLPTTGDA